MGMSVAANMTYAEFPTSYKTQLRSRFDRLRRPNPMAAPCYRQGPRRRREPADAQARAVSNTESCMYVERREAARNPLYMMAIIVHVK